jgi:hypothetical protein
MSEPAIRWFRDSPQAGDPDCLCSWCKERIEERDPELDEFEGDQDAGEPIRMWRPVGWGKVMEEARFHDRCFNECIKLGLVALQPKGPFRYVK